MNNTRRLTRRDRRRHAEILNTIKDAPGNRHDPHVLAYGRPPYPLREVHQPIPGKVTAWVNSPAARNRWLDRFAWRVEPILAALLLVLCSLLLVLAVTTRVIAK